MIHTPVMRSFKRDIEIYRACHRMALRSANEIIKAHIEKPFSALQVDGYHCFPYRDIWTSTGKPHQLDANNRTKGSLDAAAALIEVDDRYFFAGDSQKAVSKENERFTILRIRAFTCKSDEKILQEILSR